MFAKEGNGNLAFIVGLVLVFIILVFVLACVYMAYKNCKQYDLHRKTQVQPD